MKDNQMEPLSVRSAPHTCLSSISRYLLTLLPDKNKRPCLVILPPSYHYFIGQIPLLWWFIHFIHVCTCSTPTRSHKGHCDTFVTCNKSNAKQKRDKFWFIFYLRTKKCFRSFLSQKFIIQHKYVYLLRKILVEKQTRRSYKSHTPDFVSDDMSPSFNAI